MAQPYLGSPFDLLSSDLTICIFESLLKDEGMSLAQLALVSRGFFEAARQVSKTLVIHAAQRDQKGIRTWRTKLHASWLIVEFSKRPNVVNSKLEGDIPGGLAAVLSKRHWQDVKIPDIGHFRRCRQILSSSQEHLRNLDLECGGQTRIKKDVRHLLRSFPKLQELTLHGKFARGKADAKPDSGQGEEDERGPRGNSSLVRLDISRLRSVPDKPVWVWGYPYPQDVLEHLPSLPDLRSLKVRCELSLICRSNILPSLETLHMELAGYERFSSPFSMTTAIEAIAQNCPLLRCLKLSDMRLLPNREGVPQVDLTPLESCHYLKSIFISFTIEYERTDFLRIAGLTSETDKILLMSGSQLGRLTGIAFTSCSGSSYLDRLEDFVVYGLALFGGFTNLESFNECKDDPMKMRQLLVGHPGLVERWLETFCRVQN